MPDVQGYRLLRANEFALGFTAQLVRASRDVAAGALPRGQWGPVTNTGPEDVQPNLGRIQRVGAQSYERALMASIFYRQERGRENIHSHIDPGFYENPATIEALREFVEPEQMAVIAKLLQAKLVPPEVAAKVIEVLRNVVIHDFIGEGSPHDTATASSSEQVEGSTELSFLESALRLESRGYIDKALDLIYGHIDALLRAGEFSRIDSLLESTDPARFGTDLLLGLLTITFAANDRLPARTGFFERAEAILRTRPEWEERLLCGLEG